MDWYIAAMRRSFDFSGRATRPEFWWFMGLSMLFSVVVGAVAGIVSPDASDLASALFSLVHLLPTLAVGARRLHDTGRTGWWQLVVLVPLVGFIVLVFFMVRRSDEGDNAYGSPVD